MNLIQEILAGQLGKNKGFKLGLKKVSRDIYGLRRGTIITVGAKPKVGKTAFVDYNFVLGPILLSKLTSDDIKIYYYSFEIRRVVKEAKFLTYWLHYNKNIRYIEHKRKEYLITAPLLLGWVTDEDNDIIKIDSIKKEIEEGYETFIKPIFGEYDNQGRKIKEGLIEVITKRENPTGIYNYLAEIAKENGEFIYEEWTDKNGQKQKKAVGYIPNNNKLILIIIDHIRKVPIERGYSIKQNIDKLLEYEVMFRDIVGFSFINVVHLNDEDTNLIRLSGENYIPSQENFKDTRNLSEDSDFSFILFNPTYPRYGLKKHLGVYPQEVLSQLKTKFGEHFHYRTLHLIESRYGNTPNYRLIFDGATGAFQHLKI